MLFIKKGISVYDKYLEEIIELNKQGKSNAYIGEKLGLDHRRVGDQLRKNGMKAAPFDYGREKPTNYEKDYIISAIIGDGCLFKDKNNVNYRLNFVHSPKQKKYFMSKYEAIKEFSGGNFREESNFHKLRGKYYERVIFQSRVKPYFTEMYDIWYKGGKKIINENYVHEINEKVLALKYFDDGYKSSSSYCIAMDDYDPKSLDVFMKHLNNTFGIETNLHNRNRVYIYARCKGKFKDIISKYATEDVKYKI